VVVLEVLHLLLGLPQQAEVEVLISMVVLHRVEVVEVDQTVVPVDLEIHLL
jgi:hypothetical protein